ncbi:MAG TPA: single-stranded DNA-binding protein [Chloroflexota bacterium]|nr:single-stranded DNA-binding protein [Chloroflexota bacterium]
MIGNHAQFMGNLGNDPDFSYTNAGLARARFRLAVNDRQKQGDTVVPTTFWVTVTAFGKQAELATQYLHKGSRVLAAGKLEPRTWTGADGKDRFDLRLLLTEIEFLDPRSPGGEDHAAVIEELESVSAGAV